MNDSFDRLGERYSQRAGLSHQALEKLQQQAAQPQQSAAEALGEVADSFTLLEHNTIAAGRIVGHAVALTAPGSSEPVNGAESSCGFVVGDRVATTGYTRMLYTRLVGYYGHVTDITPGVNETVSLVWVQLMGRTDRGEVWPHAVQYEWPFWPDELEHAD